MNRDLRASLLCLALAGCIASRWGDYLTSEYGEPSLVDPSGVDSRTNGFWVDQLAVSAEVDRELSAWSARLPECDVRHEATRLLLVWRPLPFVDRRWPQACPGRPEYDPPRVQGVEEAGECAGLTSWEGPQVVIQVGWGRDPAQTALAHELGHAVLMLCNLPSDEHALGEYLLMGDPI